MTDRLACCVPFCRRSRKALPDRVTVPMGGYSDGDTVTVDIAEEWICADHWRTASSRPLYRAAKRKLKKVRTLAAMLVFLRVWRRCKREAIERATGI